MTKYSMPRFRFDTTHGWSVELIAKNRKEAINDFLEITGPGVPFHVVDL